MSKIDVTEYEVKLGRARRTMRLAVISDLHSSPRCDVDAIVASLRQSSPDLALMAGDIFERLDGSRAARNEKGFELVRRVGEICPVYMSVGNHENGGVQSWNLAKWGKKRSLPQCFDASQLSRISECGGILLDNAYAEWETLRIGGLSSGFINAYRKPRLDWLDDFCAYDGVKVLMCHHPEYFEKYLKDRDIDLVVSGHAHGGQWRIFGRGVFAPGQGLFPKYTEGIHFGRLVISRGLKSARVIPRFFNRPEVVLIDLAID